MPVVTNKVEDPCQECRDRHLKCDDNRPKCNQCDKNGKPCSRSKGKHKFRFGSSAKYDTTFARDQIWLEQSKNAKIQFVDQGPELENFYSTDEPEISRAEPQLRSRPDSGLNRQQSITPDPRLKSPIRHSPARPDVVPLSSTPVITESLDGTIASSSSPKRRKTNDYDAGPLVNQALLRSPPTKESQRYYVLYEPNAARTLSKHGIASPTDSTPESRKVEAEYRRLADTEAGNVPDEDLLAPSVWKKHFVWPNKWTTTQCACLLRYYVEHLGPWFDVGDPTRHFTLVVPQRARRCPPLLNAIFTAAARHLTYMNGMNRPNRPVEYHDITLPNLNEFAVLKYYQASISYLRVLCQDNVYVQDEDLLAATVILQYYEELQSRISGRPPDDESFRQFHLFVAAQANPAFASQMTDYAVDFSEPGEFDRYRQEAEAYLKGYQHASFRIALRQECARAFVNRSSVQLPLRAWSVLEGSDEAGDSIWADRHLYHYANVLQFCYASEDHGVGRTARWNRLKEFESRWEASRPMAFSPFHYKEAERDMGEVFPQIWYVSEIHSSGVQYYALARILLTVYNPNQVRIGPGTTAAARKISEEVREIVLELCGIATSSLNPQPAFAQAFMAIAMCGEHFTDENEQEALLKILKELETRHGWPTAETAANLRKEWLWE